MNFDATIQRLKDGPAVLFIGQNYLTLESGKDHILSKINIKYAINDNTVSESYDVIQKIGVSSSGTDLFQWMHALCKSISIPIWLQEIAAFPWSTVYSSAFDTVLERAFSTDSRIVQPVVNERYLVNDPRNKNLLHISYLLGYINAAEPTDRPALSKLEATKRKKTVNSFLSRLPNLVTPKGLLVVEGYSLNDQVSIEEIYSQTYNLGEQQILICSANEDLQNHELIVDLINTKKAVVSSESFASLLTFWKSKGLINESILRKNDLYGKWLTIGDNACRLPEELISKVSKSAFIIHDETFDGKYDKSAEERYQGFRRFLASSSILPFWTGYIENFAFKRDFYEELKSTTLKTYQSTENSEIPILLSGQTSSGKTVALGLLAYELRVEFKLPVIFIPKRYQRVDDNSIENFCRWAEENSAKNTIIIWDGMLELQNYYNLLRSLKSRGRKVILVCSCYSTSNLKSDLQNAKYIFSPIELSNKEKSRFVNYLESIDEKLATLIKRIEEPNLLALLYRYLPVDKHKISSGVHDEYSFFLKLLENTGKPDEGLKSQLYEALDSAGMLSEEDLDYLDKSMNIGNEKISVADFLIFSIMIPGQFGLNVPFELLLNVVGYDALGAHIFKALNKVDLVKWYEDSLGNIELGPRTTLEAKLLTRFAGGKSAEVDYILTLLENIKNENSEFGAFDRQIEFAVRLLNEIGPNSSTSYFQFYYDITQSLKNLRENRFAYHPRLVLKEALFLRAIVKRRKDLIDLPETDLELLSRAEQAVSEAINDLGSKSDGLIGSYLRVELSAICGFLAQENIKSGNTEKAKDYYNDVKMYNNYSFSTNPGNYLALDIAFWTTESMINANLFNNEERIEAESDLLNLIELVEAEGVSDENLEEFEKTKYKFYNLVGKENLAEEVFDGMLQQGYTAGIYFKAKRKLGLDVGNLEGERYILKHKEVLKFLSKYFDRIKSDGRCLFLLLKTFWISKSGKDFFNEEKETLSFKDDEWDFILQLTELIMASDSKFVTGTVLYIRAIAQFHLNSVNDAISTFEILQEESYKSSYGKRRVMKYYMASSANGNYKYYSGEVRESVSRSKGDRWGSFYVPDLDINVPFTLVEFGQNSFQKGEVVNRFYIAFNFLGPIAVATKNI